MITISNILNAGNKVDIIVKKKNTDPNIEDPSLAVIQKTLRTSIYDITDDERIIVYMPMEKGKLILLPIGYRSKAIFYTENGLLSCDAIVKERFKTNNAFLMQLEFTTPLSKYQRRDYYRMECMIDVMYRMLPAEYLELPNTYKMLEAVVEQNEAEVFQGTIADISGGGCKIRIDKQLTENDYLILSYLLKSDTIEDRMLVAARVINCEKNENLDKTYDVRLEFLKIRNREREAIIKYIFETERKSRNYKKG